jgi:hypothetical protein
MSDDRLKRVNALSCAKLRSLTCEAEMAMIERGGRRRKKKERETQNEDEIHKFCRGVTFEYARAIDLPL